MLQIQAQQLTDVTN